MSSYWWDRLIGGPIIFILINVIILSIVGIGLLAKYSYEQWGPLSLIPFTSAVITALIMYNKERLENRGRNE